MDSQGILQFTSENVGLTKNEPISLEFMLARELTPIMSRHYSLAAEQRMRERNSKANPARAIIQKLFSSPAKTSIQLQKNDLVFQESLNSFLVPRSALSSDINLIGVYGMGIDPETNHWWYGTNHLGIIHELDEQFNLVNRYSPKCVVNFRDIAFHHNKAYVADAGCLSEQALHMFALPNFTYEKSIVLEDGYSFCTPDRIFFDEEKVILGGQSNGRSCKKLDTYRIQWVDVHTETVNAIKVEGLHTIFQHENQFYGMTDFRDKADLLKPGYSKSGIRFLTKLDPQYRPTEHVVEIQHPTSTICSGNNIYVDRRGTLFQSGSIYNKQNDTFESHLICSTVEGKLLRIQKLHPTLHIGPMVFNRENNLIVLLHYYPKEDNRLIAVKYKVVYPDTG